jgi:hypothetical protein
MRRFGSSWGTDASRSLKPQSSISLLIRDADALMPSFDSKTMERPSYHVHASPIPRPQLPAKPSLYNFNYRVPTHHPPQTPLCVPAYYRGDRALVHTSRTGSPHGTTNLDVDVHMSTLIWTQMLDHIQDMYAQRKTSPSHTHHCIPIHTPQAQIEIPIRPPQRTTLSTPPSKATQPPSSAKLASTQSPPLCTDSQLHRTAWHSMMWRGSM